MSEHILAQPQSVNAPAKAVKESFSLEHREKKQSEQTTLPELLFDSGSGAFAEPRVGYDFSRVMALTGMERQTQPLLRTQPMVQRFPKDEAAGSAPCPNCPEAAYTEVSAAVEPAVETAPPTGTAEPMTGTPAAGTETTPAPAPGETPASALIVEDSAAELGPGQIKKSEFLSQLRSEVCLTVEAAIAGTGRTTEDCPYLDYWFDFYDRQDSAHIERAIHRYVPEAAGVTAAGGYITLITQRARQSAETWARTGEITGVPEGLPMGLPGMGLPGGIGSIFFKARNGGARKPDDPRAIQAELREGQPLEGSVRSRMESAFGMDFAHVRTHTDSAAAGISDRMNARAFTVGEHVAFGANEYKPGTLIGDALIAHEMAHVVQQSGANSPAAPMRTGDASYNTLEKDADNSAFGVIASLWNGAKGALAGIGQNTMPHLRSGLRLQRCRKTSPAPTGSGLSSGSISGSVSGLTMNATATYSNCSDCSDGLEAIQVFWGTRRTDGVQVGTHQTTLPSSAHTFDSFVDGGRNSPGGAVYSGDHPYYVGRADLPASYGYNPAQGSAGSYSGCVLNISDTPGAATLHDEAYFETAIVCLNYQGRGTDKMLESFKWGFINLGTTNKPSPSSPNSSNLETHASASAKHEETLSADYPGYSHV